MIGHFEGASRHVEELLSACAHCGSHRLWADIQTVYFFRCRGCARVVLAAKVGAHGVALGCASFVGSAGVRGQGRLAGPGSAQRCCFAGGRLAAQRPLVIPVQTAMTLPVHIAWSRVSACADVVRCRRFVWR